jgi:hypothetical protein
VVLAYGEIDGAGLAVAEDAELDLGAGGYIRDGDLELAAVENLLAVELGDDVSAFKAGVRGGGVGCDLGDDGPGGVLEVEEVGVFRGDVVNADAEVAVVDAAGLDDLLRDGVGDLSGDGEAGAGEGAAVGDDEGVDADEFTVGVDEGSAGVAGVDGGVGLDVAAGLAGVVGVGVLTVDGADDAAGDGELEVAEGAAEGEDGLAGLETGGVAPGDGGEIVRVDLDDGEVGELVDADDLGVQDAAVMESDLDLRGSVDDVVVGDDVAVGRDDDAAAYAVLKLWLLRYLELAAAVAAEAEELGEAGGELLRVYALHAGAVGVDGLGLGFGGDGDVDDGWGDAGGELLHGAVGGGEGGDAVVVQRRG